MNNKKLIESLSKKIYEISADKYQKSAKSSYHLRDFIANRDAMLNDPYKHPNAVNKELEKGLRKQHRASRAKHIADYDLSGYDTKKLSAREMQNMIRNNR